MDIIINNEEFEMKTGEVSSGRKTQHEKRHGGHFGSPADENQKRDNS